MKARKSYTSAEITMSGGCCGTTPVRKEKTKAEKILGTKTTMDFKMEKQQINWGCCG